MPRIKEPSVYFFNQVEAEIFAAVRDLFAKDQAGHNFILTVRSLDLHLATSYHQ